MELKRRKRPLRLPYAVCLNRTFMELKQLNLLHERDMTIVLIAPLWN